MCSTNIFASNLSVSSYPHGNIPRSHICSLLASDCKVFQSCLLAEMQLLDYHLSCHCLQIHTYIIIRIRRYPLARLLPKITRSPLCFPIRVMYNGLHCYLDQTIWVWILISTLTCYVTLNESLTSPCLNKPQLLGSDCNRGYFKGSLCKDWI